MSTLTLKPAFSKHGKSGSRRDSREQHVRAAMQPRRERTLALTAGTIAIALFSVLAPMAGNPTERLFALDAMPTIPTDDAIAEERKFELRPTLMGPAITSEALILAEEEPLHMPALEVRVTPEGDEIVHAPHG
jgi:hypothetical protein